MSYLWDIAVSAPLIAAAIVSVWALGIAAIRISTWVHNKSNPDQGVSPEEYPDRNHLR